MSVCAKYRWSRGAAFAGVVLATAALAIGVTPRSAAAQYVYGQPGPAYSSPYPYHQHGHWGEHDDGWHRGWSKDGRDHGGGNHASRGNEGFSGSSSGGRGSGGAVHGGGSGNHSSGGGGNGGGYAGWLGAHAR
jgi:hypothetical protein